MEKTKRTSGRIRDSFPHASKGGRYDEMPVDWWTNGFWPGILWLIYQDRPDDTLRSYAESCERKMDEALTAFDGLHHDVGFMWSLTSVARYKLLRSEDSRRRALLAASILAARLNLSGKFIRAWNEDKVGWAIIDCLMNLPLLYWASETTKDPRFRQVAMAHADTAIRHFVRADGSCRHIVSFDPETGEFQAAIAGQGQSPESAWARGAAWAIYGFALGYKYTGAKRYLATAERVADFFAASLPVDLLPPWDFRAADGSYLPKDSSAAACAASGLLELAKLSDAPKGQRYWELGAKIVRSLDANCGAWDEDEEGLLTTGTAHKPLGWNIEVPLIYGDYFFVEALAKMRGRWQSFW